MFEDQGYQPGNPASSLCTGEGHSGAKRQGWERYMHQKLLSVFVDADKNCQLESYCSRWANVQTRAVTISLSCSHARRLLIV